MITSNNHDDAAQGTQESRSQDAENVPAWELIDAGRYRPRRIRGSYLGRELG